MPYSTNLDKALKKLDLTQPAFLLICKDRVRIEKLEARLLKAIGAEDAPRTLQFGDNLSVKDLTALGDELSSMSLFSSKEVTRVTKAHEIKAATLDAFLKSPPEGDTSNILLLLASELKSNSRLRKHFTKRHAVLELKPIPEKEISTWTIAHASTLEMELSGKVATLIADIAEGVPDRIDQLLTHLKIYCDLGKKPTCEDVLSLFHFHPDPNEFQLLEAILRRPTYEVEITIAELLDRGKNPFLLLNLIGKSASKLLLISKCLAQGAPPKSHVSGPPWLVDKQIQLARATPPRKLERLHAAVIVADSKLKGKSLGVQEIFGEMVRAAW